MNQSIGQMMVLNEKSGDYHSSQRPSMSVPNCMVIHQTAVKTWLTKVSRLRPLGPVNVCPNIYIKCFLLNWWWPDTEDIAILRATPLAWLMIVILLSPHFQPIWTAQLIPHIKNTTFLSMLARKQVSNFLYVHMCMTKLRS